jgi:FkbM family methyltransferase
MGLIAARFVPRAEREYVWWATKRFGRAFAVRSWLVSRLRSNGLVRVPVPGRKRRVWLRPGTVDQAVYDDVFLNGECRPPDGLNSADFVIDAGAHIGLSSVFFAMAFPRARIAAVEPDAENLRILRLNTVDLPQVTVHEGGLWGRTGSLRIANPAAGSWAFQLEEGGQLRAWTVDELCVHHGITRIDLLKLDVEGAEVEVFGTAEGWIDRVDGLIVELHDRLRSGCSQALIAAIGARSQRSARQGANTVMRLAAGPAGGGVGINVDPTREEWATAGRFSFATRAAGANSPRKPP